MTGGNFFVAIDEDSAELGLGGRGHYGFDDFRDDEDGAVVRWVGRIV